MFYAAHDAHVRELVEQALFHADHVTSGLADHDAPAQPGAVTPGRPA